MSPARLLNALHRTAACAAALAAIALLHASPARAGEIMTSNCLHGFGYDHGYNRSYNGNWGNGRYGANGWGNGSGSGYGYGGCVETRRELVNPYVIHVPPPKTEKEVAEAAERDRLWVARCRPTIRQDQYGVRRYHYAAPGCEYGKYE
jgi:hypothetical protein